MARIFAGDSAVSCTKHAYIQGRVGSDIKRDLDIEGVDKLFDYKMSLGLQIPGKCRSSGQPNASDSEEVQKGL